MAVDTLGHLLALHVTPANEQDRTQVTPLSGEALLAQAVQEATEQSVALAHKDAGYTGEPAQEAAQAKGIQALSKANGKWSSCRKPSEALSCCPEDGWSSAWAG